MTSWFKHWDVILEHAFAKVNLWLNILGQRDDGFHELCTLMVPITLFDEVQIGLEESGIHFECLGGGADVPVGPANLAWRAADLFLKESGIPSGVRIQLRKTIPSGAGLGGGSSDAAAVVRGLQNLTGGPLSRNQLHALALRLGSDVPFFLESRPAICTGRGEKMDFQVTQKPLDLVLVQPPFPVSTAWAFQRFAAMKASGSLSSATRSREQFGNDLEIPVFYKYPVLRILRDGLADFPGMKGAFLSGSGSSICAAIQGDPTGIEGFVQRKFGTSYRVLRVKTTAGMAT